MTEHALTPGDPRRTIHFVIGRAVARRTWGGDTPSQTDVGDSRLAWTASRDDPGARISYAFQVTSTWAFLAFAFAVAILVIAIPVRSLFGAPAGDAVAAGCLVACMFCIAGSANVYWRGYWYGTKAKRLARHGTYTAAYAAAMRRTLPRNSSLIFQAAIGIVTLVLWLSDGLQ